ncbi:hypothetical protein OPV22_023051 [Ensete ventricosum]|uniref:Uncharacterized protein n=1 Tax=Ensete ventricosum TaxID=4639 RepID=A0AAV8QR15_ENSVE|nr:hypothetical protein OPV22_023051 [Ensete ventricosum]
MVGSAHSGPRRPDDVAEHVGGSTSLSRCARGGTVPLGPGGLTLTSGLLRLLAFFIDDDDAKEGKLRRSALGSHGVVCVETADLLRQITRLLSACVPVA